MSDFTMTASLVILYRSLTVIAGVIIVFFGYRLFRVGVFEKAGELRAAWGEKRLVLKQAAPGTFFALFGAAIIIVGLARGITFDRTTQVPRVPQTGSDSSNETAQSSNTRQVPNPLVTALFGKSIPGEIRPLLKKIAEGEQLTSEEQASIKTWMEVMESIQIHANADVPPVIEGLRDAQTEAKGKSA